jgi:hypothetical protein
VRQVVVIKDRIQLKDDEQTLKDLAVTNGSDLSVFVMEKETCSKVVRAPCQQNLEADVKLENILLEPGLRFTASSTYNNNVPRFGPSKALPFDAYETGVVKGDRCWMGTPTLFPAWWCVEFVQRQSVRGFGFRLSGVGDPKKMVLQGRDAGRNWIGLWEGENPLGVLGEKRIFEVKNQVNSMIRGTMLKKNTGESRP